MSAARNGRDDAGNRVAITVAIMLATIMQVLDTTIANVALPSMSAVARVSLKPPVLNVPPVMLSVAALLIRSAAPRVTLPPLMFTVLVPLIAPVEVLKVDQSVCDPLVPVPSTSQPRK